MRIGMKLDKEAVRRLLALNDAQLAAVITRLASENGIDLGAIPGFEVRPENIAGIRRALAMATDEDVRSAAERLGSLRRGKDGEDA